MHGGITKTNDRRKRKHRFARHHAPHTSRGKAIRMIAHRLRVRTLEPWKRGIPKYWSVKPLAEFMEDARRVHRMHEFARFTKMFSIVVGKMVECFNSIAEYPPIPDEVLERITRDNRRLIAGEDIEPLNMVRIGRDGRVYNAGPVIDTSPAHNIKVSDYIRVSDESDNKA